MTRRPSSISMDRCRIPISDSSPRRSTGLIAETAATTFRAARRWTVRGQVKDHDRLGSAGLLAGLHRARFVLIYLLIVVKLPVLARPPSSSSLRCRPALAGIVWMLFLSRTPREAVPALMGAIMCMGVATAQQRARDQFLRASGMKRRRRRPAGGLDRRLHTVPPGSHDGARHDRRHGADGPWTRRGRPNRMRPWAAGRDRRSRPFATVATLFFVPTVFVMIHGRKTGPAA